MRRPYDAKVLAGCAGSTVVVVDAATVEASLGALLKDQDLGRHIL